MYCPSRFTWLSFIYKVTSPRWHLCLSHFAKFHHMLYTFPVVDIQYISSELIIPSIKWIVRSKDEQNCSRPDCKCICPIEGAMCTCHFINIWKGFCLFVYFCFSFFEATLIYDQPERLNSGCMGLDSNAVQMRSGEFHKRKNLKRHEVDAVVKLPFVRGNVVRERKEHAGKLFHLGHLITR